MNIVTIINKLNERTVYDDKTGCWLFIGSMRDGIGIIYMLEHIEKMLKIVWKKEHFLHHLLKQVIEMPELIVNMDIR